MSLYRQYRPKTFADVVGQDAVVTTLENAVTQGKLSHAYLFAGSRGTGKTSVARILAKAMLTQGVTDEKLNEQIRTAVDDGSLVDLVEIDGASNRRIEDSRDLVEKIQFTPVAAAAKVYIIDEAHMLTKEAFNALLKTLEEPPAYAYFILATTELQKIPVTIQSRCQRFAFRHVPEEDIIRRLQFIADQEHVEVDRTALRAIAHHADGAVRDAISLLDQLRSLPSVTVEDVKERTGQSGHEVVEQIIAAVEARNQTELLDLVRRMESAGTALETVARALLTEIRRRLHQAIEEKQPIGPFTDALTTILDALRDMRIAPVPGLVLEAALLSLMEPDTTEKKPSRFFGKRESSAVTAVEEKSGPGLPADMSPEARRAKGEAPAGAKAGPGPNVAEPAQREPAVMEVPEVSMSALRDYWPQVLQEIFPPSLKMSLKNGHVHGVSGAKITIAFSSAFHRDKVGKTEAARAVEATLEKIFKRQLHIDCVLEEEEQAGKGVDKEMVNLAEAAAEVF